MSSQRVRRPLETGAKVQVRGLSREQLSHDTSERDFQQQVLQLAQLYGWRSYHTWLSVHSAAGFPDLVLVRGGRVIFGELKSERGRVSQAQRDWLDALQECPGVEVHLWRPADWPQIVATLRKEPTKRGGGA